MEHEIAFSDPGAQKVIDDLRTILSLTQQIKAAGAGIGVGGGGAPGIGGRGLGFGGSTGSTSIIPGILQGMGGSAWSSQGGRRALPVALRNQLTSAQRMFERTKLLGAITVIEGKNRFTYDPSVGQDFNPGTGGGAGLGRRGWNGEGGPFLNPKTGPAWWKYTGVGSVSPGLARMWRRFGRRVMPSLMRAVRPMAYIYAAEQLYRAVDEVPAMVDTVTGGRTKHDEEQRGIRKALRRVPEARRQALQELQWTVSAEAERQEGRGFRLERNKSMWPWNWETVQAINKGKVRDIAEEVIWRERYLKTAWMAESVGEKAYGQADPQKWIAQQSALIATGRIYKSPYPKQFFVRAKSGG